MKTTANVDSAAALRIDRDKLDAEVVRQPELYYHAAEAFALAVSYRDGVRNELEASRAEADGRARSRLERDGMKITEPVVLREVELDKEVVSAAAIYGKAKLKADLAEALRDAFHQRAFVLRDLATLYVAGYFADSGARAGQSARLGDERMQENRKRISEKRTWKG